MNSLGSAARRTPGFSLIEMLIAMVLGIVVVAAMGQFYQSNQRTYRSTGLLAELNEAGRFATEFLTRDLRMAGFVSCGGDGAALANTLNTSTDWMFDTAAIEGFEGGVDTPPGDFSARVAAGTDSLIVRHAAAEEPLRVTVDDTQQALIQLAAPHGIAPGEILVISDPACTQAALFQVTTTSTLADGAAGPDTVGHAVGGGATPGNCTTALNGAFRCADVTGARQQRYVPGSLVTRFQAHAYFVSTDDPPALVRRRLAIVNGAATATDETLLENVEALQILYGIDLQNDGQDRVENYVGADQVANWENVVSVRTALLLRSHDANVMPVASQVRQFDLLGSEFNAPADGRMRRVYSTLIALRNRVP